MENLKLQNHTYKAFSFVTHDEKLIGQRSHLKLLLLCLVMKCLLCCLVVSKAPPKCTSPLAY